jgi:hypothetical protein
MYYIIVAKFRRQVIPASFYDNIVNHETKECFLKYSFHAHCMMPDISIQKNEGIAKFFALMLEGPLKTKLWNLNVIFVSSWDICIHLEIWRCIAYP